MSFFGGDGLSFQAKKWLLMTGSIICIGLAFALIVNFSGRFGTTTTQKTPDPNEFVASDEAESERWMVYVTGAVMNPGVFEVAEGARVNDALKAAGGFAIDANPEGINLAARIEDGQHIHFPRQGDQQGEASQPEASSSSGPLLINLNRATAEELQTLPGVGPSLSGAIIDYRGTNGPFTAAEELMSVRGIGAKRFESLKDRVTVK